MIRILSIAFLFLCLAARPAAAQQRHELTAREAVDYGLKNNTLVKNALLDVDIQQQTNREITASALPSLNGNYSNTANIIIPTNLLPGELAGLPKGTFIPVRFGTTYNQGIGVSLQQLLFDGQVFVGLQARRASIQFAEKAVDVTEENIRANIYKVYYQLSASSSQLAILDANIARIQKLADDTRKLFENGFAERLDISRLEVQLANLQTEKNKAVNQISNGYYGLKVLMGMPTEDTLILTEKISETDIRSGVLDAPAYAFKDRQEYQYALLGKELREYNVRRYKLTKYPTVALAGALNANRMSNTFGFDGRWFSGSYLSLSINMPIFDGWARQARVQRAQLELRQVENNIRDLELTISRDVQVALNNYNNALSTLNTQRRNMELAEQVYNQTRLKFQEGIGSNTEITSAQADLQVAQNNYILALYDASNAKIDFLKATGKLQ
ncbi:MAG TPA: TolC family protein [Chitinophagaceae bacterium]|jgi:outer membrane protein TolC|nr:TolC family protein [Chitinophagaceae bacterium]